MGDELIVRTTIVIESKIEIKIDTYAALETVPQLAVHSVQLVRS